MIEAYGRRNRFLFRYANDNNSKGASRSDSVCSDWRNMGNFVVPTLLSVAKDAHRTAPNAIFEVLLNMPGLQ